MQRQLTLTMQDIADVARVRRPVVSAWRKRELINGIPMPFPRPVTTRGRVEHFDLDDVVHWLERTRRGNNPDFQADAVASAVPTDASFDDIHSLLCLRVLADVELAGHDAEALVDLADEVDPDDDTLFSEVEQLAGPASELTAYVDGLYSAALGPADALDRLQHSRLGRSSGETIEFGTEAVHLLGLVTAAIARQWTGEPAALVDASLGRSGLAERIAISWAENACHAFVVAGDSPEARRLRRAGLLHGLPVRTSHDGSAIVVLPATGLATSEAIRAIDELQLALPEDRVAVVVGPASLLCDRTSEPAIEQDRDAVVRTGKLRLAARLPRGLWSRAPRQTLGLWVLGARPARRVEDRAVALADLSDASLTDAVVGDFATDSIAALGDIRARSFRFARVVPTSTIITAREIVPYGVRPPHRPESTGPRTLIRVERLLDSISRDLPALGVAPRVPHHQMPVRATTIAELISAGFIMVRRGSRLDDALSRPGGAVRTFDPVEGRSTDGFDPLELEQHHPRAIRTEPDDVVFRNAPRPVADVDVVGGSVVASPARILRMTRDCPIGPTTLSRVINRQSDRAREWRGWTVPVVPAVERAALDAELRSIDVLRAELAERIDAALELTDALIDGLSEGAITLRPDETGD